VGEKRKHAAEGEKRGKERGRGELESETALSQGKERQEHQDFRFYHTVGGEREGKEEDRGGRPSSISHGISRRRQKGGVKIPIGIPYTPLRDDQAEPGGEKRRGERGG